MKMGDYYPLLCDVHEISPLRTRPALPTSSYSEPRFSDSGSKVDQLEHHV